MGIFPFEFSVHLIGSLLTVLPNFTFHDYYSTVPSIFRPLFHLLHHADWHNGFSSAWIMSVNVCLYKKAVVLVLDLVHPQCDAAYMRGNLGLMLKIYIFYHKWTKIFRETIKFHIRVQWQTESSTIQTVCSLDWTFLSSLHRWSQTAFLGPAQSFQTEVLRGL